MALAHSRSAYGNAVKRAKAEGRSPGSDPVVLEKRRDLTEDRIRDYVLKVVADAPPLTPEQQSRLRGLFQASPSVRAVDDPPSANPARQPGRKKRAVSG